MSIRKKKSHIHQQIAVDGDRHEEESNFLTAHEVDDDDQSATQMTCDVLCSLSASCSPAVPQAPLKSLNSSNIDSPINGIGSCASEKRKTPKTCPKQHQLPMFLSKTYHMIDRCSPTVATWSEAGDNFVVKNVEKFASSVLPLYFKHSNFSSFARQLNFYGFRKLRTDPILTSDVDPRTACYVRFYHEKFQKDRPELLHQIKRATKSDQQSKDDVESLKAEVSKLKECIGNISADFDRKLAELSYEYNRRITAMSTEYDKLVALVQQLLARNNNCNGNATPEAILPSISDAEAPANTHANAKTNINATRGMNSNTNTNSNTNSNDNTKATSTTTEIAPTKTNKQRAPDLMDSLSRVAAMIADSTASSASSSLASSASSVKTKSVTESPPQHVISNSSDFVTTSNTTTSICATQRRVPNLMDSLSQAAAMSLQNNLSPPSVAGTTASSSSSSGKRSAEDEHGNAPSTTRARTDENICVPHVVH